MPLPSILPGRWSSRLAPAAAAAKDRGRTAIARLAATAAASPSARRPIEILESRVMMSVSTDSDGWTVVGKSRDTRVIYVSSSEGRDSNSGLSASKPIKTLAKAKTLVRTGKPDWVLLKRGNTWREGFGTWRMSGRSQSEPMLISTYGSGARPLIKTGDVHAFDTNGSKASHLALIGLSFHNSAGDPSSSDYQGRSPAGYGVRVVGQTNGLLIEDCAFDAYRNNVSFGAWKGGPRNVVVRRSIMTDARNSGVYAADVQGLRIEQNVLDHNGWHERTTKDGVGHNVYLQASNTGVVVTGNVVARAGSHGVQARGGGQITNNLFYANPIGMSFGLVNGGPLKAGGITGKVDGNVFIGTREIGKAGRGWGYAIEVGNTKRGGGAAISNNIIAHGGASTSPAISVTYGSGVDNPKGAVGLNDLTIANNVAYGWNHAIGFKGSMVSGGRGAAGINGLVVKNNQFQRSARGQHVRHPQALKKSAERWSGNVYSTGPTFALNDKTVSLSAWRAQIESTAKGASVRYAAPSRSLEGYGGAVLGSKSASAFLNAARKLADGNWKSTFTAAKAISYIRGGFNR
jgi:hypothetical protein